MRKHNNRRLYGYVLPIIFCCLLGSKSSFAYETIFDDQGLTYLITRDENSSWDGMGECEIMYNGISSWDYTGFDENLKIPATMEKKGVVYKVVGIGENAIGCAPNADNPDSKYQNKTVKSIDLSECTWLRDIGKSAFACCVDLKVIGLENCHNLRTIGDNAFYHCYSITELDLGKCILLESIGSYAFCGCKSLESVGDLTDTNLSTLISEGSFFGCEKLSYIGDLGKLKDLEIIDPYAFAHTGLSSVGNLGNCKNLLKIGDMAFGGCPSLAYVGDLGGCTKLRSIGEKAFVDCYSLVDIGDLGRCTELVRIYAQAFRDCSSLEWISLPANLNYIEKEAFYRCSSLKNVISYNNVPPSSLNENNNRKYDYFDSTLPSNATLFVPCGAEYTYDIHFSHLFSKILPIGDVNNLELSVNDLTLKVNEWMDCEYNYNPYGIYTPIIEWSVADPSIVELYESEPGKLSMKGIAPGSTTISGKISTCDNQGSEYVFPISVSNEILSSKLILSPSSIVTAYIAEPITVTASVEPANATVPEITWTLSRNGIVEIVGDASSSSIEIRPRGLGNVTLYASATDGSRTSASCEIEVKTVDNPTATPGDDTNSGIGDDPLKETEEGPVLVGSDIMMRVGQTASIKIMSDDIEYLPKLEWSVRDNTIAEINFLSDNQAEAFFTGLVPGETTWTAKSTNFTIPFSLSGKITVFESVPVTSLSLNIDEITIASMYSQPITVKAFASPSGASIPPIKWSMSQTNVVKRVDDDETGSTIQILPNAIGQTVLTASSIYNPEITASCIINVINMTALKPAQILEGEEMEINADATFVVGLGETIDVRALPTPEVDYAPYLSWTVEQGDENIRIYDTPDSSYDIKIEGVKEGRSGILMETAGTRPVRRMFYVNVVADDSSQPVTRFIRMSDPNLNLVDGESYKVSVEVYPKESSPQVDWRIDDIANIVKIESLPNENELLITALKPGTTRVIARTNDGSGLQAFCDVRVAAIPVEKVTITTEDLTINLKDGPITIFATLEPENATVPQLVWQSSDLSVATIEHDGGKEAILTPVSVGTATITLSHSEDDSISHSVEIKVTDLSSIKNMFDDGQDEPVDVYDLQGRMVRAGATASELRDLKPGLYIMRQGATADKVLVK